MNAYLRVIERLLVGAAPNNCVFCEVLPRRTSIQYPFHLKSWGSPYLGIYSALPGSADKDMPPLSWELFEVTEKSLERRQTSFTVYEESESWASLKVNSGNDSHEKVEDPFVRRVSLVEFRRNIKLCSRSAEADSGKIHGKKSTHGLWTDPLPSGTPDAQFQRCFPRRGAMQRWTSSNLDQRATTRMQRCLARSQMSRNSPHKGSCCSLD